jgi:hypothetical protein
LPLIGLARFDTLQIIAADTCVGIDDAEGLILALQIKHNSRQDEVFDHIGEIAGMIGVTVIHGLLVSRCSLTRKRAAARPVRIVDVKLATNEFAIRYKSVIQRWKRTQ